MCGHKTEVVSLPTLRCLQDFLINNDIVKLFTISDIAELLLIFFRDVTPKPAELDYGHHYEHLK